MELGESLGGSSFSTNKRQVEDVVGEGDLSWEGPIGSCSITTPFSLIFLIREGEHVWNKKGIKFWIERLIINLAEELGFRGTQF